MTVVELAPPKRRSYSQLSTFLECPELYYYKYIEKVAEQPSVWSVGGTTFHSLAEQYLRGDLGPDPDVDTLQAAWDIAWEQGVAEVRARNPDAPADLAKWRAANRGKETAEWWQVNGLMWVRDFITWWTTGRGKDLRVLEDNAGPMLERELTVHLGGVEVIAIPDALVVDEHGQIDVLDYKSSKDQRGPGGSLQLGVYKAALLAHAGLYATFGLYYMTRSATLQPRDLTAWTPENIGAMFADFDRRVRSGDFTPTPGDACKFCPFKRDRCTYYNQSAEAA